MSENLKWKKIESPSPFNNEKAINKKKIFNIFMIAIITTLLQFFMFTILYHPESSIQDTSVAFINSKKSKGDKLNESDFYFHKMTSNEVQNFFINNKNYKKFIGQTIQNTIELQQPILLSSFQNEINPNKQIPFGKRLFVLTLENSEILNLIKIGDKVDIIAHLNIPEFGKATETILEDIEVIDSAVKNNHLANNTISFYVSPDEVKILSFMKQFANFHLSIRHPDDRNTQKGRAITLNQFIQDPRIQKILKSETFRVIKGTDLK